MGLHTERVFLYMRYFIRLRYHGGRYHGWQIQPNALTVQQVLDDALSKLLRRSTETVGCGRTDTGVHASDFYAHFDTDEPIDAAQLHFRLDAMRLPGIDIVEIFPVEAQWHARFSAIEREYEYRIALRRNPFLEGQCWFLHKAPKLERMNAAAKLLLGKHDFGCFSKSHTQTHTDICDLRVAEWRLEGELLIFRIVADRFLRNMVRAIVGTLVDVGQGKLQPAAVHDILASGDRSEAGMSVPAEGLFLHRVQYPEGLKNS